MARVTAPPAVDTAAPSAGTPLRARLLAGPGAALDQSDQSAPEVEPDPPDGRWHRTRRRLAAVPRWVWACVAVLLLVAAALTTYAVTRPPGPAPVTQRDVDLTVQRGLQKQAEADAAAPAVATLAHAAIAPSLVVISTRGTAAGPQSQGSGAGVVVNTDGTVLTALHVVERSNAITVTFSDGTASSATIASRKPESDIATLTPSKLPETVVPAVLGGGLPVGAPVFAVGHPLGLTDSLSAGVVSALDRTVRVEGNRKLEHLIQFDAAVNPGNSGGPLLDSAGQVVGIVTGLANPTDQTLFVGIGFAVPIATAGGGGGIAR